LNSAEIRDELVKVLELDLVGPWPGHERENEVLDRPPSREYLTGFIVPYEPPDGPARAQVQLTGEETEQEGIDQMRSGGLDDDQSPEAASSRRAFFPSSIGVSVLVPREAKSIKVTVLWGDYKLVEPKESEDGPRDKGSRRERATWQRKQWKAEEVVSVARTAAKPATTDVNGGNGLKLVTSIRPVEAKAGPGALSQLVPEGTRSVSIFLVNYRNPAPDDRRDEAFAFQARLMLHMDQPFVSRPNLRGLEQDDWDERVADLQYADCYEFAVGHGVATNAREENGKCNLVSTVWIPSAEVEKVEAAPIPDVELSLDALAAIGNAAAMRKSLDALVSNYATWIDAQKGKLPSDKRRREVGEELLNRARQAKDRIAAGIACLDDPDVLDAFRLMNRVMATVIRKRRAMANLPNEEPKWRPFQLAFILMNLRGIADPLNPDRSGVDLLFFPTGGGKTEAYLGLAAFTLALRRMKNPGLASAGVSVLMRYTLRLLTLEQLSRAATLICALELERQKDVDRLGPWPFEIGLWVGMAATPNLMGRKGDNNERSARSRTIRFKNDSRSNPSPIPLEECPWCGTRFEPSSFSLVPSADAPTDLRVTCANRRCEFKGGNPLPVVAIDEPIYRRLPCFIVATVDKFAGVPWLGLAGGLFGKADRYDAEGFYGPCDPGRGSRLSNPLLPPDLIIQDELHLISGPLGTIAGLYEAAIDALCSREVEGKTVRPKIVASTATVRRADAQVKALFGRDSVDIFPPPGPDRRNSFFALTMPKSERNARRYVGIAASGRSLKRVMLVTYLALMGAAQRFYEEAGGRKNPDNPADPYMSLVGYFNSLRELGGSRRIVEDEVTSRLKSYGSRKRVGEARGLFADRDIQQEVLELTSRESTDKVANSKRRLALRFEDKDRVDIALATNMISVGLDIMRLGLMVVLGQPKTTAEYIQATSRVGRDDERPGLVVTLLNIHRPRDRSHYERFEAWHASFYRGVETTSVTPFSPRAIDRSLAAVTVGLARHGNPAFTPPRGALLADKRRAEMEFVADTLAARAERHAKLPPQETEELRKKLKARVDDLLDAWASIAYDKDKVGAGLQYQREEGGAPPLLFDPLDPDLAKQPQKARKFKAQRSMRNVEQVVNLWVQRMDGVAVEGD
jgi:hypothetical protein